MPIWASMPAARSAASTSSRWSTRTTYACHPCRSPSAADGRADEVPESFLVQRSDALAAPDQLLQAPELRNAECAQDVREPVVEPGERQIALRREAVVTQAPDCGSELGLVGCDGPALACGDDLARVEGDAAGEPERAAGHVPVARAERSGGVLEQGHLLGDRCLELLPVDGATEEVHADHHPGTPGHGRGHELRSHEKRVGVDVDQHGTRTAEVHDVRRGGKRVGGHDDLVALAHAECEQGEVERRRPGRDGDRLGRADSVCDRPLERRHTRPHRQLPVGQHLGDRCELGLADVRSCEPDLAGHAAGAPSRDRYQAIVCSRPWSSSTRASQPSTSRAFSTSGMRSSTSA